MIAPAVPYECDSCPTTCTPTQVPGTPGTDGTDGTPGTTGANAYTQVTTEFLMPAVGGSADIEVGSTDWMVPEQGGVGGQVLAIEFAGSLVVTAIIDGTNVTVRNDGYAENAAPGTTIPALSKVGVSGRPGEAGTAAGGSLLASNNLSDVADPATSLANLGAATAATLSVAQVLQSANNLSDLANAVAARTNLGVAIGANVQAFSAFLDGLAAAGPGVANQLPYLTAANVWALSALTAFGRGFIASTSQDTGKKFLGIRQGLLGYIIGADLSVAGDVLVQVMSGEAGQRVRVRQVVIENANASLATATAGLFMSAGGIGTIAADQALAAATGANIVCDLTVTGTTIVTATDFGAGQGFFFRVGTPQAAATCNVWIFGDDYT